MNYTKIIRKEQYALLVLNRGKANPLNHAMIRSIRQAIQEVNNSPEIRGVILTGNTPNYFSVGLDIKELYAYDSQEISAFLDDWEAMIIELASMPKPLIAAINGYSPAGGCVLAITADYRMMAEDSRYVIGLNEIAVGITVPTYIFQLFSFWVGSKRAYQSLMAAKLFNPLEALEIGLVDELHPLDQLESKAEAKIRKWLKSPDSVLHSSKRNLRVDLLAKLKIKSQVSKEERLKSWFDPDSRLVMKSLLEQLNAKSSKK